MEPWEQIQEASTDDHGAPVPAVMKKIIWKFSPKPVEEDPFSVT